MDADSDTIDIRSKILQNTLIEVASSRNPVEPDKSDETCCVICLDNITDVCEARPCGHRNFDYLCLVSWLEQQAKCPLCKSSIDEVWYDFESDKPDAKSRVYLVPSPKKPVQQQTLLQTSLSRTRSRTRNTITRPNRRRYEEAPRRRPTVDEALLRRQDVYRDQLYSLHVGSNLRSGHRDLTPRVFESDPEIVSRARTWLRRELQVFEFLRTPPTAQSSDDAMTRRRANNAEFLLEYIIAILKTVDIQGSQGQAEEMLKDFLGRDHTKLLLHELKSFLRSPWSLETWDNKVQYPTAKKRPIAEDDEDGYQLEPRRRRQAMGDSSGRRKRYTGDSYRPTYSSQHYRRMERARQNNPD
ncbi:uncharacterized protein GGS22DRAFT_174908 [Annulohypoxylon maeteangense]|uniref:uncharacterized protein n=1 Tax=Annulohypoxylon maeteangense TaxID=1927788 RepID=UPI002007EDAA|nr:uncharacterized protein GGS22DRAFT_174908 [Annulohypoxylon maeteangense]KAI0880460.1 hypothetical protein GGS22DRAFT_174908 [Annulohypoxylon maeteangense]